MDKQGERLKLLEEIEVQSLKIVLLLVTAKRILQELQQIYEVSSRNL
jgi:hypothetical protein